MSRIHEALKKAEQERDATQGGTPQPEMVSVHVAEVPVYHEAPPAVSAPVSPSSLPTFGNAFSIEALLAQCPQMQWKPDLGTMLFMNATSLNKKKGKTDVQTHVF